VEADAIPPLLSTVETIVLLGAFNPLILDPYWLVQHEIIDEFDLEYARDTKKWLVTRDITIVEFRRFSLQADPNRVQVAMTQETETPLLIADVVVNVFRLLSHTPVHALGLNHACHEELNEGRSEEILNRLAPRDVVEDLVPGIGVASLSWRAERTDDYAGHFLFTVQPSVQVRGLFLSLNDHYDLGEGGTGETASNLVADEYQESSRRSDEMIAKVIGLA
jgi:hypothetical protein